MWISLAVVFSVLFALIAAHGDGHSAGRNTAGAPGENWYGNSDAAVPATVPDGGVDGPWPECLGLTGEACVALIESKAPDLAGAVIIIPANSMVTMDYRTDRVRVFVDELGNVQRSPMRG